MPSTVDAFLDLIETGWDAEVARRPHGQHTTVVVHVDVDTQVAALQLTVTDSHGQPLTGASPARPPTTAPQVVQPYRGPDRRTRRLVVAHPLRRTLTTHAQLRLPTAAEHHQNARRSAAPWISKSCLLTSQSGTIESKPWQVPANTCSSVRTPAHISRSA